MRFEEHNCDKLPKQGIYIFPGSESIHDERSWVLRVSREATEQDLEDNHYLEEVGEEIWSVTVEIAFCPYCGESLNGNESSLVTGEFVLLDSSGWSVQRK